MNQDTVILAHTLHHPTEGGLIRVHQSKSTWTSDWHLYLSAEPHMRLYMGWSTSISADATEAEIKEEGYKLLLTFICAAYIENEE